MDEENSGVWEEFMGDFAMFLEGGFISTKQLDEINSIRIFNAAQIINPKNPAPKIGLGHIALLKMDIKNATSLFEEAIAMGEDTYLAQSFLGICYVLTKDKMKKGEKLLEEAIEKTDDPTIKNLASLSLKWAKQDVSKKPPPYAP